MWKSAGAGRPEGLRYCGSFSRNNCDGWPTTL
jgi:hypothetical protein